MDSEFLVNDEMLSGLRNHFNGTVEIMQREITAHPAAESTRSSRRRGRPPAEKSWRLEDAKQELMRRYGVAEPVAHVTLQRFSMECRIPFEEAADIIRLGLMALDHLRASDGHTEE